MKKIDQAAKAYIRANYLMETDTAMSEKLGVSAKAIGAFRKRNGLKKERKPATTILGVDQFNKLTAEEQMAFCRQKLMVSANFHNISNNYTKDELEFYIHKFAEYYSQIRSHSEVTPVEESQIHTLCQLDVLINNNSFERKQATEQINDLEEKLRDMQKLDIVDQDLPRISQIMEQIRLIKQAQNGRSDELIKLSKRRDEIYSSLKTTRDQRIEKLVDKTDNFFDLVKFLIAHEHAERESREMELSRIAMERQIKEWGKEHEFMDGEKDKILLSEDTVDLSTSTSLDTEHKATDTEHN